ncbi:hypothetical protein KJ359_003482 [Pestalotiopsis sp. 9143b]|nr:hypothetical protein KJ359_003482 [Pestalotiopsis sp. 9143b]
MATPQQQENREEWARTRLTTDKSLPPFPEGPLEVPAEALTDNKHPMGEVGIRYIFNDPSENDLSFQEGATYRLKDQIRGPDYGPVAMTDGRVFCGYVPDAKDLERVRGTAKRLGRQWAAWAKVTYKHPREAFFDFLYGPWDNVTEEEMEQMGIFQHHRGLAYVWFERVEEEGIAEKDGPEKDSSQNKDAIGAPVVAIDDDES